MNVTYMGKVDSEIEAAFDSFDCRLTRVWQPDVEAIQKSDPDLLLIDLDSQMIPERLLGMKRQLRQLPFIGLMPQENIENYRRYLLSGIEDIVIRPFCCESFIPRLQQIYDCFDIWRLRVSLPERLHALFPDTPWGNRALRVARAAIKSEEPLLIHGETGTGKDLLARTIHGQSDRGSEPFIGFNCASVPPELLGGELFGSVCGAFTGAVDRCGKAEAAGEGTLFLDELGELPRDAQVKLLRLLENREVIALGSNDVRVVRARVIAAVSQPRELLKGKILRSDLLYRLNTLTIEIPPLRERRKEIPGMMDLFRVEMKSDKFFSSTAIEKMVLYDWPGNIRQLRNVVRRSILLAEGDVIFPEAIDFF